MGRYPKQVLSRPQIKKNIEIPQNERQMDPAVYFNRVTPSSGPAFEDVTVHTQEEEILTILVFLPLSSLSPPLLEGDHVCFLSPLLLSALVYNIFL